VRPQKRAPNYRVALAWVAVSLVFGAVTFGLGMAIHGEKQRVSQARDSSIYYCATGVEFPEFQLCKEQNDRRDI
jgi:hypothetical protein